MPWGCDGCGCGYGRRFCPAWAAASSYLFFRSGGYPVWHGASDHYLRNVFYLRMDGCAGGKPSRAWFFGYPDVCILSRSLRSSYCLDLYGVSVASFPQCAVSVLPGNLGGNGSGTSYLLYDDSEEIPGPLVYRRVCWGNKERVCTPAGDGFGRGSD